MLTLPKNALQTVDEDLLKNLSKLHYLDLRLSPSAAPVPTGGLRTGPAANHQVQISVPL
uniref:Uncharacterized protein n=1 Tax=Anguilla anguilla TaxID=7936 RepID=A0A0E9SA96_ANGAN